MARSFLVETKFTAQDLVSSKMNRMNRGVGRFAANLTDSNHMLNKGLTRANRSINRGIMVGIAGLGTGLALATRQFIALDNSVRGAGAKFKDLDTTSVTYQQSLDDIQKKAREVASTSEFMATDTAGALDKMAMAGLTSKLSMSLLAGTTDLATAASTDLTTAVDIVTDSMGAFKLMTDDSAQAQKNLNRISDVMAKTTTTSNTSLQQMFESVQKGAPAFTDAGQRMETFAAFTGVMANSGIKGGEAGTALRNVMLRLANPVGKASKLLKKLGVVTADGEGNFRDAIDIIADMENGLKGMGTQQKTAALATIFGAKTITGISLLLGEGSKKLRKYRADLIDSGGAANKMATAIRAGLQNQLNILGSTLSEKGFQIVEVFEKQGGGAIKKLTEWVKNFDVGPIIDLLNITISFFKFLAGNWKILLSIAAAIKAVSIALGIINIAATIFGITLAATPIGWVIGIVAVLAAGLVLLATNWDNVTEAIKTAAGWIKKIGSSALGGILRLVGVDTDIGKERRFDNSPVSLLDPTQKSGGSNNLNGAELPPSSDPLSGLLDINFNNKPEDVSIMPKGLSKGINVGITPTESF
ncbi:MAG: phage tail tape measure protein [Candidatus Helarchaeota archaeon]